ncbi:MAG: glutaminyl-tRNA synthase (glutamine-hydrolyzing) subunit B [Gemmatimonadetes bacterium 13_1_40CM_70_11]|nr:MAG: glutaminyl-tRNA synthase (glutamine-hydrolyzing) subunit B [Gemmatimonadetes bacterium 13_1_40CM_70_11]
MAGEAGGGGGNGWETVIGLETHVQLRTTSKMFCGCSAAFGDPPNTNVCPVCLGLPGALPAPNEQALKLAVRTALALGCTVHPRSVFARKNYFYPDLPKGYQITQYEQPLATAGRLSYLSPDRGVATGTIVRLHVEEDAGKSLHDRFPRATAVDLNRAGVPLIEIVTGADFRSPAEARAYLLTLKQVLEYSGVSDCDMEKGSLRVDANVSVRRAGDSALGTKTEVKNINSFAYVEKALAVERDRQKGVLAGGGTVVQQTMLYDAKENAVRPQRTKEESHDSRYFPEPDLPPLVLPPEWIPEQQAQLPELPATKRERFVAQYALSVQDAAVLTANRAVAEYYESVVHAGAEPKPAANWVMGEVLADAKDHQEQLRVPAGTLAQLIALVQGGTLSHQAAKRVFAELAVRGGGEPRTVAEALGVIQVADTNVMGQWVDEVLRAHPGEVTRYKSGETKLMAFFVGQVMKASKGKADPKLAPRLLEERLRA